MSTKRALFLVFAVAGCNAAGEGASGSTGSAPPRTNSVEPATPKSAVAWPAAARLDRTAAARLSLRAAAVVKGSPVPALVPNDAALTPVLVATSGEHFFAFSVRRDGITLSLHATGRVAHTLPVDSSRVQELGSVPNREAFPGVRTLRGVRGLVTQNEKIWTATWIEGGVAYALDVECDNTADRRCSDQEFLLDQLDDLVYVGGAGASREAGAE